MEKRLILFFTIVAVIMIVSQRFLYPKRVPSTIPTAETPADTQMALAPSLTMEADTPHVSAPAVPTVTDDFMAGMQPALAETVAVVTDDLELAVASVGGTIVSCRLPQFPLREGGPVSLFPADYEGALGLTVNRGGEHSLATLPFHMQVTTRPTYGIAARVTWTGRRGDGAWIRKTLEVPEQGYACRLHLESRGLGLAGYEIAIPPGLQGTEPNQRDDHSYFAAMAGIAGSTWKKNLGKLKGELPRAEGPTGWVGLRTKYFMVALVPDSLSWHRVSTMGGAEEGAVGVTLEGLARGGSLDAEYTLYMGPLDYARLAPLGGGITNAVELGNRYLRPIGRLVLLFLTTVHGAIPNYGIVIILFAIAMKVLLHPLTMKTTKSMQRMQELQPKLNAIKEKYKNNAQKQQQETMKLYKEHGINPLGGCLPMVVQMPIFFAMYPVLRSSVHLRGATFIPGIVGDLSQPNPILPILMGITQFISAKMMATDKQNKALAYVMPIFMTYIFFQLPSGLVLYWLTFNMLQIGQQMWQKRRAAGKPAS